MALLAVLLLASIVATPCTAISAADSISSAVVNVKNSEAAFYVSSAAAEGWGESLEAQKLKDGANHAYYPLVYNVTGLVNGFGCTSKEMLLKESSNGSLAASNLSSASLLGLPEKPFVLLVDRGRCTFAEKAFYAQELGAAILIVTDTLEQLFHRSVAVNATEEDKRMEFSCSRGSGKAALDSDVLNLSLASWKNDAGVRSCSGSGKCSSHICVPSGGANRQVCCAWDIPDPIGFRPTGLVSDKNLVSNIAIVRISIAGGDSLKGMLASGSENEDGELLVSVYQRDTPAVDPSQVFLWIIAGATVLVGSYKAAAYERTKAQLKAALIAADTTSSDAIAQARFAYEEHNEQATTFEWLGLKSWLATTFLLLGIGLLALLPIVNVVVVMVALFGIASVFATFQTVWQPLVRCLSGQIFLKHPWRDVLWQWRGFLVPAQWSFGDLLALALSVTTAFLWFLTRFWSIAWIFQDILGVCFCLMLLRTARLPNLKVATVLLGFVFIYEVFIYFVLPFISEESIMIKAVEDGTQRISDGVSNAYCLRYPTDVKHDCRSESMPTQLRVPTVLDWRSGSSILGLGNIVLPGLLLVFCARYDYATRGQLFGRLAPRHGKAFGQPLFGNVLHVSGRTSIAANRDLEMLGAELENSQHMSRRGLFCLLLWGYTIGLVFANIAILKTGHGQPTLMYLIPCTLGLLVTVGWRRGILNKLWEGPPELYPGYGRCHSISTRGGLDIFDATRLRGLSSGTGKAVLSGIVLQQQRSVSGSYASEDTPKSQGT
ncbi:hypothetical protein CCR75_003028 [Bremia lactucae]|uniref:PA domain-containing protein n=1 Tax=Bremia lactucae TaxID=4779 RepID=A0A976IMG2_BRELC|nr:hypothetical protein CCR75_003028 [Bremia lactucae]